MTKPRVSISRGEGELSAPVSRLCSVAPQKRVGDETIARPTQRAVEREQEFTTPWYLVSRGTMLREVSRTAALCSPWKGADFCVFDGVDQDATAHIERLLTNRIRLRKGEVLYRAGGAFSALYAIRAGSCKTVMLLKDGREQVAGFYMAGEIIGLDGIDSDIYECQATALEDTEVRRLPFHEIENLAHYSVAFQHNLHRLLTNRYARARALMVVLGTMSGDQRLAGFLLDLSQRYRVRGYSSCEFVLRLTREEIGSYLGLKLETVSRLFSRFQRAGLLQVQGRTVKLLDLAALNQIVDGVKGPVYSAAFNSTQIAG